MVTSAKVLELARRALTGSASLKVMFVATAIASRFFMPLAMLVCTESMLGWSSDWVMAVTSWDLTQESTRLFTSP